MRESNYRAISANKAAVTITTSLYDRRALDVTSDKPLVNSLNYLTYLVSSSAKVRETLSVDGGIERLIEILHECHNSTYNLNDNIFNSEKKLLTAWKWTLAFQCLVLVGTRGTEKIRQKVVKAGILPIIATVLDNYLSLHERTFIHANSRAAPPHQHHQSHQHQNPQNRQHFQQQQQDQQHEANRASPQPQHQNQNHSDHANHRHLHIHNPQEQAQVRFASTETIQPNHEPVRRQEDSNNFDLPQQQPLPTHSVPSIPPTTAETNPNIPLQNMLPQTFQPIPNFSRQPVNITSASVEAARISGFPAYFNNNHVNNLTNEDYDSFTVDQLFKLIRFNSFNIPAIDNNGVVGSSQNSESSATDYITQNAALMNNSKNNSITNDVRRRYMIINIIKKLKEEKELEILDDRFFNDNEYEMDNNLQFLTNLCLQDCETNKTLLNSKIAVRNFTETGVVIPRDDDIVWSLQLLAYISKYSYLKDVLQNTHLIIDMSIRDKQLKIYLEKQMKLSIKKHLAFKLKPRPKITPKSRKALATDANNSSENSCLKRFNPSASNSPQMLDDINSTIHDDNFFLEDDKFELYNKAKEPCLTENAEVEDEEDFDDDDDEEVEDLNVTCLDGCSDTNYQKYDEDSLSGKLDDKLKAEVSEESMKEIMNSDYINQLYESIINCESIIDDLERDIKLFQINEKLNRYTCIESRKLVQTIMMKRQEKKEFLIKKWNYDDYDGFDIDDKNEDQDDSLIEYKKVSLFPIVEKFTFLTGTDMYYWSGVIMRNSCRRNELRGSVRQCGNLECGKWERYPREFSKCRRCKRTKYCSRECQMKAWHCHRNWCVPSNSSTTTSTTNASSQTNGGEDVNMNPDDSVGGPEDD